MKRIPSLILSITACMFIFFPCPASGNDDFISRNLKTFSSFSLNNGIDVHVKSEQHSRIKSLVILIDGGKQLIPAEKAGLDKTALTLMTMESKNFSDTRRRSILKRTSASIAASDGLDYNTYQMKTIDTYFDEVFTLYADLFLNPVFSEELLKEVKTDLINGYKSEMSDGYARVSRAVNTEFFKDHPYESFLLTPETLTSLTREDVLDYYRKIADPSRITVFAVGNYNIKKLKNNLNKTLGKLPTQKKQAKPAPQAFTPAPSPDLIIDVFDDLRDGTSYIRGNFVIAAPTDPGYWATALGLNILSDVLSDLIRTRHNLTYSVWAHPYRRTSNYANISVYRTYDPARALALISQAIEVVLSGKCLSPFGEDEGEEKEYVAIAEALDFYKTAFATSFYSGLQDNTSIALQMADAYALAGDCTGYLYVKKNIDRVTAEEVVEALKAQLIQPQILWAVTAPQETAETVQ